MEASALQAPATSALQPPATLPQTRIVMGMPLLRFRSDDQLVALFRAGHDEAFRAIHERYHKRLFAYTRQMLPARQDAEDALQDVFVRAYAGLRASDQELALRAWLFRVAHNRCIDELRRPAPPPPELLQLVRTAVHDPLAEVDLRESLRRLVEDIRRLPEQQRSALLMRELVGMSYSDLSVSLGISIGAVKSLLVRARVALAQAAEARDTSCLLIREQLVDAHDRGMRPNATSRKHMRDCVGCKSFRHELRGMSRQLAAVSPIVGPLGVLAKLGFSGGAGGGAAGGGGLALLGGGGAASAGGAAVGVNHLATLLVAAVATAGGAVELQHTITASSHHPARAAGAGVHRRHRPPARPASARPTDGIQVVLGAVEATVATAPKLASDPAAPAVPARPKVHHKPSAGGAGLSPSSGASALINSSKSSATSLTGTSTTGTSTAASGACSTPSDPGSTLTSTTTSSASSTSSHTATDASTPTSTSTQTTGSTATPTTSPTVTALPSCTTTSAPATNQTTSTASTSTSSTTSGGSTSTSSGSATGSTTAPSSTSTGSSGGSSSVGN